MVSVQPKGKDDSAELDIIVNDASAQGYAFSPTSYSQATGFGIVNLNFGDTVCVKTTGRKTYFQGCSANCFTGVLLCPNDY